MLLAVCLESISAVQGRRCDTDECSWCGVVWSDLPHLSWRLWPVLRSSAECRIVLLLLLASASFWFFWGLSRVDAGVFADRKGGSCVQQ